MTYYPANWIANYFRNGDYAIVFLEGEHKGEKYLERECAIAKDDKYLLGERND